VWLPRVSLENLLTKKRGSNLFKGFFGEKGSKYPYFEGKKVELAIFRPFVLVCRQYMPRFAKKKSAFLSDL